MFVYAYAPENSVYSEIEMRVLKKSKKHPIAFSPDIIKAYREIIVDIAPEGLDKLKEIQAYTYSLRATVINRSVIRMDPNNPNIVYTVKAVYNGYLDVDRSCVKDRSGNLCLRESDIEWGTFKPANAYSVYVSRDLVRHTSQVYRLVIFDAWNMNYLKRVSPTAGFLDGIFAETFHSQYDLDSITKMTALPGTGIDHKMNVEMVIPEPQYYTPLHSYIHTGKFCMDDAIRLPVKDNLLDKNSKISLMNHQLISDTIQYFGKNGERVYPENGHVYFLQIRWAMEQALKFIITEFMRHQVKTLWFTYDSERLMFGVMNNVENSFMNTTPDLYESLVNRLIGRSFEVRDHRIEENFEEIHKMFGPFQLDCQITDCIIRAKIRFNKEYRKTGIYGVDFSTSVHDLIAFSNDFMIEVNQPFKIL